MEEEKVSRQDIHILSRNSNWSHESINDTFYNTKVYAGKTAWSNLLRYTLLGVGIAFAAVGILFFFAFNWDNLHKFVKLGMIEVLLLSAVSIVLFKKSLDERIRNFILAGASVLVGVLFAVYGQIYQTGANAHDFFSGWTLSITLWALFSGFPILWFLFLILCNITLTTYAQQVADWAPAYLFNLLFVVNTLFVIIVEFASARKLVKEKVQWLTAITSLAAVLLITTNICTGIFESPKTNSFFISIALGFLSFALGIWYGFASKQLLYLATIPFAIMIICISFVLEPLEDPIGAFFVVAIIIIAATTFLISQLVKLNKRWHDTENKD